MRKLSFLLIIYIVVLSACQPKDEEKAGSVEFKNVNQSVTQSFSDLKTPDIFKIELTGRKPEDMVLTFSIKKADGKEIYNTRIKGTDLLGSTDPNMDLSKEKDQIIFLKTIADDFFC